MIFTFFFAFHYLSPFIFLPSFPSLIAFCYLAVPTINSSPFALLLFLLCHSAAALSPAIVFLPSILVFQSLPPSSLLLRPHLLLLSSHLLFLFLTLYLPHPHLSLSSPALINSFDFHLLLHNERRGGGRNRIDVPYIFFKGSWL